MINPDKIAVDVKEQIDWLMSHKAATGLSWPALSPRIGIASGTLSAFGTYNYAGNQQKLAQLVFKYRQTLDTQEERQVGVLTGVGHFETRTSLRLRGLMILAHGGRITAAGTSPGTGKTMEIRDYAACASNVFVVTMRKDVKTVNALTMLILRAIGIPVKGGWGTQMSDLVIDRLRGRRALLVIDEANHCSLDQLEQIRGIHDESGCGVFLSGNEELMARIESGVRSDAFARLHSRIASSHIQTLPHAEDVVAFCDAWQIEDAPMRELLSKIALTPAAGGLREIAQIVEQASMIAADEHRPMSYADLREAKATRVTRNIH